MYACVCIYNKFVFINLHFFLFFFFLFLTNKPTEIKESVEAIQALYAVTERLPKSNYHLFERLIFHLAR